MLPLGTRAYLHARPEGPSLNTPIGSNAFVEKCLDKKLTRLKEEISMLSEMTHLHECFTLLRSCASACKVTHLMRTKPPAQLTRFLRALIMSRKEHLRSY